MHKTKLGATAPLMAIFLLAVQDVHATACEHTAVLMHSACRVDAVEEQRQTFANCINIADRSDRLACIAEARAALPDEVEACVGQFEARLDACELLGEDRYDPDPLADPANNFVDVDEIGESVAPNPYFNLTVGHTYVLRAGEDFEETVIVYVTDETVEVRDMECRIVVDAVVIAETGERGAVDYEAAEFTDDLYAQDDIGNVYYCGEVSRNFEDGVLDNLDGSFISGRGFDKGGLLIKAMPAAGESHRQEYALGEAEDLVTYDHLAAVPSDEEGGEVDGFPCAPGGCLRTFEQAPLDPESTEFKYYKAGVGFVLAVSMEDGEIDGEREELVCTGDSLDILFDPACGIANPEELLEDLCDLASQFCPSDDEK